MEEEPGEDVFAKVVSGLRKHVCQERKMMILPSVAYQVVVLDLIAKFVRRET